MVAAVIGAFVVASYWGPSHWPGAFSPAQSSRSVNAPTPGKEEAERPLGAPAPVAVASSAYRFVFTNSTAPVAYDPCRPIHYVTRLQGAPAAGAAMISQAIAQVSAATGLHFVDDGTTAESASRDRRAYQPERYGDRWAPVLIVWTSAVENPDFAGDRAGQAGSTAASRRDGTRVYVSGQVELDGEKLARIATLPNGRNEAGAIIQHELGHLVGLDHVGDATQLMFATSTGAVTSYAAGDLSGLAMLGRGTCAPDL